MNGTLEDLLNTLPQVGTVTWMGVRPARHQAMVTSDALEARPGSGLTGDRYAGSSGKREVTLIQWEHLPVIASVLGRKAVDPALLRRNIAIKGINLLALKHQYFCVGDVLLLGTDLCQPCSKMETALGPGGYNAMRGHGGITAQVIRGGIIRMGDKVILAAASDLP